MCIAIIKPSGVSIPTKKELQRCFDNNPHGAGFMYNDGEKVVIHKGFMTFKDFYTNFMRCNGVRDFKNKDLIIHFRISTSGGTSPETTHPFVVCDNIETMRKTDLICGAGFVHNGIITGHGSKDYSDSMEFNKKVISKLNLQDDSIDETLDSLAKICNSRFAILTKNRFIKGGSWVTSGGRFYSNNSFEEKKTKYFQTRFFHNYCDFCGEKGYLHKVGQYQLCNACYNDCDWNLNWSCTK